MPKTPLPSLAWDELAPRGVHSIYDPFMGTGNSLYAFKRYGVRVIGSDLLESTWCSARALNENNTVRLSEEAIASFASSAPPNLSVHSRFASWVERGLFTESQAAWLGYWREQFDQLDGYERGLAVVAIGWMIDNWLKPLEQPGASCAGPSAMTLFLKRANQWVWDNGQVNATLRGNPVDIAAQVQADACYLYLEPPMVSIDLRTWLTEAWVQGRSEADLAGFYQDNPFFAPLEEYRVRVNSLFERMEHIRIWAIQYRTEELDLLWGDHPSWLAGRDLVAQQHLGMGPDASGEMVCVAVRA